MMRRVVFICLGVLECLSAGVLVHFAWQLPGPADVQVTVARADHLTRQTGEQVRRLRAQFQLLHERRPQMQALAKRLQEEMQVVNEQMRNQHLDYGTVKVLSEALGDVANGLDGLSETLDPQALRQFAQGLKAGADFLQEQVGPTAEKAAADLERTTKDLRADALHLSAVLREAPPDLKAAREIYDSLGRFDEGLERLAGLLNGERVGTMRDGFKGLEEALNTGADRVERLGGYTYPMVTFNRLQPVVEQRPFWPEGAKIAEGMRKGAKGATAGIEEIELLSKDLPKLRLSLEESRKAAGTTREALGLALKQQEKVEALLRNVPNHAARLAEDLPQLAAGLTKVLRDTAHLKQVGILLRHTQRSIETALDRWPELRKNLGRSAVLLRNTQAQLQHVVDHRSEYEASLQHTLVLSRTFAAALPLLSEQLEMELDDQQQALSNLGDSIDDIHAAIPAVGQATSSLLQTTRLLLALMAVLFALHGCYVLATARRAHPLLP
jgi:hypothetical protein